MKPRMAVAAFLLLGTTAEFLYANDWPEWRGLGRRGVLTETGLVETFPEDGLRVSWRTPVNSGYSGPAVASGRVFVTDAYRPDVASTAVVERAMALDEQTGEVVASELMSKRFLRCVASSAACRPNRQAHLIGQSGHRVRRELRL